MRLLTAILLVALGGAAPAKVDVGQWSYGLASGGGSLWAGGLEKGGVLRVDPTTNRVVGHLATGERTFNLTEAPGAVWARATALVEISAVGK